MNWLSDLTILAQSCRVAVSCRVAAGPTCWIVAKTKSAGARRMAQKRNRADLVCVCVWSWQNAISGRSAKPSKDQNDIDELEIDAGALGSAVSMPYLDCSDGNLQWLINKCQTQLSQTAGNNDLLQTTTKRVARFWLCYLNNFFTCAKIAMNIMSCFTKTHWKWHRDDTINTNCEQSPANRTTKQMLCKLIRCDTKNASNKNPCKWKCFRKCANAQCCFF